VEYNQSNVFYNNRFLPIKWILKISAYYTIYKSDFGNNVVKKQQKPEPVYAVIIDAGSTGSRVLALAFQKTPST